MKRPSSRAALRSAPVALAGTAAALLLSACQSAHSASPVAAVSTVASHPVKVSLREGPVYVTEGPTPNGPPTLAKEAGLFTGSLGNGVDRTDVRVIAGTGTRELFTRDGSIFGNFVFTGTPKPGGDTIVGTLTITGGSGKYTGAHGTLHIDGFHYDKQGFSTENLSGTLTY